MVHFDLDKMGGSSSAEYWADQIHAHMKPNDPELPKIILAHAEVCLLIVYCRTPVD